MEILNRNTFTEEEVTFKNTKKGDSDFTLVYIGKSCFALHDLEKIVSFAKKKDFNESLNYRVRNYIK
jgi:hypothetical protein